MLIRHQSSAKGIIDVGIRKAYLMAALEQYCQIVISVLMIFVISRILGSSTIGAAVIGLGIGTIAFTIRELATSEFLIQRANVSTDDIRTATTLILGLSMIIAAVLCTIAPQIAGFYREPQLTRFIHVISVAGVLDAFSGPASALIRRDMQFGIATRINTASGIVYALGVVVAALLDAGIMSFAWGTLAGAVVRMMLSFHARPLLWMFRPCLRGTRAIIAFGGYKGASSVLDRAYEALPQLVLGHIMPMSNVGLFNRANLVCGLPDKFLLSAIFAVAFPAFSAEVRNNREIKPSYLRLMAYISVLYWPTTLMLGVLAHPVVLLALGSEWVSVVPILQLMAVAAFFSVPCILTFPILVALGANRHACEANFVGRGLSTVIICAASFQGLTALALSQFISLPFQAYISILYVRKHVPFTWAELGAVFGRSAIASALSLTVPLAVLALNGFDSRLSIIQVIVCCTSCAVGWSLGLLVIAHPILEEFTLLTGRSIPHLSIVRLRTSVK
ncbi:hypothetical protein ASG68_28160 [Rhizobium sp. Leaf453]|nr:hypothetical protein ASG68_28160 [Rhizobium sp. Leaf453]